MGKNKRRNLQSTSSNKKAKAAHHPSKNSRPTGITKSQPKPKPKPKPHIQPSHALPTLPFTPSDRILLVGEGDLSFARSLVEHHSCANVTATVYESKEELEAKYPHVGENKRLLEEKGARVVFGVDVAVKNQGRAGLGGVGVGGVETIFFNFPHVGGKSTDVNRQVRYNQELLVSFFRNAIHLLAPSTLGYTSSIVVTLFEGEPYTLWNIRDLARHSGLQVEKSFKFQASAYPGYRHARTLGVVKGKNGQVGGGWRGEERAARSFVFVRKGDALAPGVHGHAKDSSSESEEDDDPGMGEGEEEEGVEGFDDNEMHEEDDED